MLRFLLNKDIKECRYIRKNIDSSRRQLSLASLSPICCSKDADLHPSVSNGGLLTDARIIYGVAPAMGHNRVDHKFELSGLIKYIHESVMDAC